LQFDLSICIRDWARRVRVALAFVGPGTIGFAATDYGCLLRDHDLAIVVDLMIFRFNGHSSRRPVPDVVFDKIGVATLGESIEKIGLRIGILAAVGAELVDANA